MIVNTYSTFILLKHWRSVMKILIHTGYLSYESFDYVDEYRTRENPLNPEQTRAYDVSTDEKYVKVMQKILLSLVEDSYGKGYAESFIFEVFDNAQKPDEPKLSLSDLKDVKKVEAAQEKYDKEIEKYNSFNDKKAKLQDFFNSDNVSSKDFSVDFVNHIAELIDEKLLQETVPNYYIYDVINN